jgi:membrane fusion protein, adhesin transport system
LVNETLKEHHAAHEKLPHSLKLVHTRRIGPRIARVVFLLILLAVLVLWLVPWQQTIVGAGEVSVFNPNSRPQNIEAQIPGRIVKWEASEGQTVTKGQVLGEIEDIDSKFLDPDIAQRFDNQVRELQNSQTSERDRVSKLGQQITEIKQSQTKQILNANERVRQSRNRYNAAVASLKQAQKNLQAFVRVAKASAAQRRLQAEDIVRQNEQALVAAKKQLEIEKFNLDRVRELFERGLESKRSLELAENSFVASETRVTQFEDAIRAAKRVVEIGNLGEDQAEIDIARQRDAVIQAEENVRAADRDISISQNDVDRITNETNATLANLQASQQSASSTLAKAGSDIEKVKVESANVTARRAQQKILSPADGKLVRVSKFGAGSTVKAGDILATVAPDTTDRVVEIMVTDNDVSFVQIGRPVRLQFAGYPAVQFSGFPGMSVGTFGGKVVFIDPMDDGSSRYRVLVKEDKQTLATGQQDRGWPPANNLRPGAEAVGWIMLDTVPLGYELWRQFNGFPPRISSNKDPRLGKDGKKEATDTKKDDKPMSSSIKVKSSK